MKTEEEKKLVRYSIFLSKRLQQIYQEVAVNVLAENKEKVKLLLEVAGELQFKLLKAQLGLEKDLELDEMQMDALIARFVGKSKAQLKREIESLRK
ncbi:hypothetical protein HY495_01285 [Candidatus Woesearchaeota archaeon]|nr:hypothetical protein [Candidatus Woesearchaeota archaeon]